jgi:hypothetical protein
MDEANAAGLNVSLEDMRAQVEKELEEETRSESTSKRCVG